MTNGVPVIIEAEVTRFHCLTEKTRYTVGGVHNVKFILTVRDAASGVVIDGPREVNAEVKASGGSKAIAEEQIGRTQRVVIVENMIKVLKMELAKPPTGAGAQMVTSRNSLGDLNGSVTQLY